MTGPGKPPLWLCVHEAGHAVAHFVIDELPPNPGPFISSISVIAEGGVLGRVRGQRRLMIFKPSFTVQAHQAAQRQDALYDVVEYLAGSVAEHYQRRGSCGPLSIEGKVISRTLSGDLDKTGDLGVVREILAWLAPADPAAELKRLWRITLALIAAEWPGLVRVARVLQARRVMDGEEFKAVWLNGRSTPVMRERLEARHDDGLGWREHLVQTVPA